ncbi:MAG TPA: hypothetical protein VGQ45_13025 [Gaiellales bacterium]|jgi:hypothetical protein|nr:hypothetical protein [Gaiellales bacterium]
MTLWERRDLPLLRAAVDPANGQIQRHYFQVGQGTAAAAFNLHLSEDDVYAGLLALRDAGYVQFDERRSSGAHATVAQFSVTGAGMQMLGEWPRFERIVSPITLAAFLERLAEEAPTAEEESAARSAAAYVRGVAPGILQSLATGVASALLRGALGL